MGRRKEPTAEDQAEQEAAGSLAKLGKQLIGSQKPSKDVLLKHLKVKMGLIDPSCEWARSHLISLTPVANGTGRL